MPHELYNQLQEAYDFFNHELFSGRLPSCLITVQRENECIHGYFSFRRFGSKGEKIKETDEIAMNPIYFVNTRIENVLATLVHEMVHLEQAHFGEPGRGRYHNRQWGDWMMRVGLMPSNTTKEGGRRTGDQMAHYIIKNGRFDVTCKKLISKNFEITWYDQHIFYSSSFIQKIALEPVNYGEMISLETIISLEGNRDKIELDGSDDPPTLSEPEAVTKLKRQLEFGVASVDRTGFDDGDHEGVVSIPVTPPSNKKKTTYLCPHCRVKVWGRPNLEIHCNTCHLDFVES